MNKRNFAVAGGVATVAAIVAILFNLNGPDWGLHIVIFEVGQADAIAIVSSDGEACVIDAGRWPKDGKKVAAFLAEEDSNGVGELANVKLGFATHYDADHIGGFGAIADEGIRFLAMYDQGTSLKRKDKSIYGKYVAVAGDLNDNMAQDEGEDFFIRRKIGIGQQWHIGGAKIMCVGARGDTKGSEYDNDLDPSCEGGNFDENPGSLALLITLGEFEFYTAGDQTSDDWKNKTDTEIAVIHSGALGQETDIDVLKVNHHGSDTSTGHDFIFSLDPEVAVISSKYTKRDKLPKMVSIKQLVENQVLVYVTGDGFNPETGTFTDSNVTHEDDGYLPPEENIINHAGDVHIFVASDGMSYRVVAGGVWKEFSAVDSDNSHEAPIAALNTF